MEESSVEEGAYKRVGVGCWSQHSAYWPAEGEYCPFSQGCKTKSIKIV
jgi:hypothetical protein